MKRGLLLALVFLLFLVSVHAYDISCCIDSTRGCYNLYEAADEGGCVAGGGVVQNNTACYSIPTAPSYPVTTNIICSSICCRLPDSTTQFLTANDCTLRGGASAPGACGSGNGNNTITCQSLSGYWCTAAGYPVNAINLTSRLTSYANRPGTSYSCSSLPCTTTQVCTGTGASYENLCADGRDNDANCNVDYADVYCQAAVQGYVYNENGLPVSNVRIEIKNTNNNELFYTYTTADGKYYFKGLSQGSYLVSIADTYYVLAPTSSIQGFQVQYPSTILGSPAAMVVRPSNINSLSGKVMLSNGTTISSAFVVVLSTNFYALTDESGNYAIASIPYGSYQAQAYKEGFKPSATSSVTIDSVAQERNFVLTPNLCSVSYGPTITGAVLSRGKPEANISYTTDGCEPDKYIIYRCDGASANCQSTDKFVQKAEVSKDVLTYSDSSLAWGSYYTYYVVAVIEGTRLTASSNYYQIYTGDSRCAGKIHSGSFCIYEGLAPTLDYNGHEYLSSTGKYCDENNTLQTYVGTSGPVVCTGDYKCVEVNSGSSTATTMCRLAESCEPVETNYFGLYFSQTACQGTALASKFCSYDATETTVNTCYNCQRYGACADYRSEDACQTNSCGVGDCEWEPTNTELNLGLCIDKSKSSCSSCNNGFNGIFGGCDQLSCTKLGNCSISVQANNCFDCSQISCYDYPDQNSCSKGSVQLNSQTNAFISGSNDQCGIQSCKWDASAKTCYKDSDVNSVDDCTGVVDVIFGYNTSHCKMDASLPTTTLSLSQRYFNPTNGGNITATFTSQDKTSRSSTIYPVRNIYFCIAPEGSNRCLNTFSDYDQVMVTATGTISPLKLTSLSRSLTISPGVQQKQYALAAGKNYIYYYATDLAKNREIVKQDFFYVDTTPPSVNVTVLKFPDYSTQKTRVAIIADANEDVYCDIQFACEELGCTGVINASNLTHEFVDTYKSLFSTSFSKEYVSVPDGRYTLKLICVDLSTNIANSSQYVVLDADARVSDPKPSGATNKTTVTLSVNTTDAVECRYTTSVSDAFESIPASNKMTSTQYGAHYQHTATLTLVTSADYVYYVRCNYDPVAMEKISFAVDQLAPSVAVLVNGGSYNGGWVASATVSLSCTDLPSGGFGCNSTTYCLANLPSQTDISLKGSCTPNTTYVQSFSLNKSMTICTKARENIIGGQGGLYAQVNCTNVLLDGDGSNLTFTRLPSTVNNNNFILNGTVTDNSTVAIEKTIFISINGRLDTVSRTYNTFSIPIKLNQGTPQHGDVYTLTMYAQEPSGRTSNTVQHTIRYDLTGPTSSSTTFIPTRAQNSSEYIEYESDADVSVVVADDYSNVSSVSITVVNYTVSTSLIYSNGSWRGRLSTNSLPIGNFTVKLTMYDGLGNKNVQTPTQKLIIEDRIEPVIQLGPFAQYYPTNNPTIQINTTETAQCVATYNNVNGQSTTVVMDSGYTREHFATLSNLASQPDGEVTTPVTVTCTDRQGRRVSAIISVVVDLRPPRYFVRLNDYDLERSVQSRNSLEYVGTYAGSRRLYVFADEPVSCYYNKTGTLSGSFPFESAATGIYVLNDMSSSMFFGQGSVEQFAAVCKDRAGNLGTNKRVKSTLDEFSDPIMIDLNKDVYSSGVLFRSSQDIVCNLSVSGISIPLIQGTDGTSYNLYTYSLSTANLASRTEPYVGVLSCALVRDGSIKRTESIQIHVDTTSPSIAQSSLPAEGSVVNTTATSYAFTGTTSELVNILVLKNERVIKLIPLTSSFDFSIPLSYGYNDIVIQFVDRAQNVLERRVPIIQQSPTTDMEFSDQLGGSVRDSFIGKIKTTGSTPEVTVRSVYSNASVTVPTTGGVLVNGTSSYTINISSSLLYSLLGRSTDKDSVSIIDENFVRVTDKVFLGAFEVSANDGVQSYSEVLFYNPYAESLDLSKPEYFFLQPSDIENVNGITLTGKLQYRNYIVNGTYYYDALKTIADLVHSQGNFALQKIQSVGKTLFGMSFLNDLFAQTSFTGSVFYDLGGPVANITIYPTGAVTYTPTTQFSVVFYEPVTALNMSVTAADLSKSYTVYGASGSGFFFNPSVQLDTPRSYVLTVIARDAQGNVGSTTFPFAYENLPFILTLVEPKYMVASTQPFVTTFTSNRPGECRYSATNASFVSMTPITGNYSSLHTFVQQTAATLYIACIPYGEADPQYFNYTFSFDSSAPVIGNVSLANAKYVNNTPYLSTYPLVASLTVPTDDASTCRYSFTTTNFSAMVNPLCPTESCFATQTVLNVTSLADKTKYSINLVCKNRAGLLSVPKNFTFGVDLSLGDQFTISSPQAYDNKTTVNVTIDTTRPFANDSCRYKIDGGVYGQLTTANNLKYSAVITATTGNHTVLVNCTSENVSYIKTKVFIIDTSAPIKGGVVVTSVTTSRVQARADNFTDPESGIEAYEFVIGTAKYPSAGYNDVMPNWTYSSSNSISISVSLNKSKTYYVSVRARNKVNIYSEVASSDSFTLSTPADPNTCFDNTKNNGETGIDCGTICNVACPVGELCTVTADCNSNSLICTQGKCAVKPITPPQNNHTVINDTDEPPIIVNPPIDEPPIEDTSSSSWWLWLLLLIALLLIIAAIIYYVFAQKKEKEAYQYETTTSASMPIEQPRQDTALDEQKDELKRILKKKLVEEQKAEAQQTRTQKFETFTGETRKDVPVTSKVDLLKNITSRKPASEKVQPTKSSKVAPASAKKSQTSSKKSSSESKTMAKLKDKIAGPKTKNYDSPVTELKKRLK